jgi:thiol-disulfide isomerase/thioredoxin
MRKLCVLALLGCVGISAVANAAQWMNDHGAAVSRGFGENRAVLINFSGSDWCPSCISLKQEVFSKPEFHAFADNNLVLCEIYVARYRPQAAATWALMQKYGVQSVPAVILLDNKGGLIGRMGYGSGGPEPYVRAIQQLIGRAQPRREVVEPTEPLPAFGGAPTGPAPKYKELTLKSISGAGTKKLALINNQTLAAGESAKVRLGAGEIKLRCEEIRDKSVVVTVDGKPERKELRLKDG